jgi:hypothetical protein
MAPPVHACRRRLVILRLDGTFCGPTQPCLSATWQFPLTRGAAPSASSGSRLPALPFLREPGQDLAARIRPLPSPVMVTVDLQIRAFRHRNPA